MADVQKVISIADQVVSLAEDGLRGIDRTITPWPAEFRAIIWDAVADIASHRAADARSAVGSLAGSAPSSQPADSSGAKTGGGK